eukprot:TRINITY_DN1466_c1_g1_i1.p1 TRINITY_DN1466_c1_g1~~TRINITY_DN1466_c1_g1_i1.p1  ORF type:complete len:772 (+),score=147.37 TRINITY_DN1466_c1_g1_i1:64-2379(+)
MAGIVHEPPLSIREKGERIVIVFNVSNARHNSVKAEHRPGDAGDPGALHVAFSSVSPSRHFEKLLRLPHPVVSGRTVSDVQTKCVTVQLLKTDPSITWGNAWTKAPKGKPKQRDRTLSGDADLVATSPIVPEIDADMERESEVLERQKEEAQRREKEGADRRAEEAEREAKEASERKIQEKTEREAKEEADRKAKEEAKRAQESIAKEERRAKEQAKRESERRAKEERYAKEAAKRENERKSKELEIQREADRKATELRTNAIAIKQKDEVSVEENLFKVTGTQAAGKSKAKRAKSKKKQAGGKEAQTDEAADAKVVESGSKRSTDFFGRSGEDRGLPVMPPTEPEVMNMMMEAQNTFAEDPGRATVLLRVAARKGYLPALLVLGHLAAAANNEQLLIEALCALLSQEEAQKQILPDLLRQCAVQLSSTLRDPKHSELARAHASELREIKRLWPIVRTIDQLEEDDDQRTGCPKKYYEKPAVSESVSKSGVAKLPATSGGGCSGVSVASAPSCEGQWQDRASSWMFEANVPSLGSLSEGRLDISNTMICLYGPGDISLVRASMPPDTDSTAASAKWSKKHHLLTIEVPKLARIAIAADATASDAPVDARNPSAVVGTIAEVDRNVSGRWVSAEGEIVATVKGLEVLWPDGSHDSLQSHGSNKYSLRVSGEIATLDVHGRLVWDDGDVWMPEIVSSLPATAAPSASETTKPSHSHRGDVSNIRPTAAVHPPTSVSSLAASRIATRPDRPMTVAAMASESAPNDSSCAVDELD